MAPVILSLNSFFYMISKNVFLLQPTLIQTKYSRLSSVDQACSEWEIWVACIMEVEWVGAVTVPAVSTFNLDKPEEKTAHLAKSVLPRGE